MTREERLEFCRTCTKKGFDPKKGIVCSLTGDWATFNPTCPDYQRDEEAYAQRQEELARIHEEELSEGTLGMSKLGIKSKIGAGIVLMIGGIVWLVAGALYMDRIFFYPIFMIGGGVFVFFKGMSDKNKARKRRKRKEMSRDILDMD